MGLIDYLKDAAKLAQELNRMDLYQDLLSAQEEVADLRTELLLLREENADLVSKLQIKESLTFEKGVYWIRDDDMTDQKDATPVCPTCWDSKKLLMRLKLHTFANSTSVHCHNCKGNFTIESSTSGNSVIVRRSP